MLMRAAALYVLFVLTSLAGGIAVWQSFELRVRDGRIAESLKSEESLQSRLQEAADAALSAARRARLAENALAELNQSQMAATGEVDALKAELAAAQQQLSVAETSMTEAEERLAEEVAAHANLKAELAAALDTVKRASFEPPPSIPATAPSTAPAANTQTIGRIEPDESAAARSVEPTAPAVSAASAAAPEAAAPIADSVTKDEIVEHPASNKIETAVASKAKNKSSAENFARKKKTQAKAFTKRPAANRATSQAAPSYSLF